MTRTMITLAALAFFWPYWAQQRPQYYYPRPAAQPVQAQPCPNGRCCLGGRCRLAAPKELPKPPAVKMAGDAPEVK